MREQVELKFTKAVDDNMKPIERISIVEQVINNLKDYLAENKFSVGDKMPTEKEICELYKVGRSTAREAYRMMQAVGMLEVKRGKGAYFKGFPDESTDDNHIANWFREHSQRLTDYIEVRTAIETMATKLAITRISDKQLKQLNVLHDLFVESAEVQNYMKMAFYDEEFHHKITEASNNELLVKIEKMIAECIVDYRMQTYLVKDNVEHAISSHKALLDAFANHDAQAAMQLMANHLDNSLVDMQRIITDNK